MTTPKKSHKRSAKVLYPRTAHMTSPPEVRHRAMARRILDRVRAGSAVRDDLIAWALVQTGDAGGRALSASELEVASKKLPHSRADVPH